MLKKIAKKEIEKYDVTEFYAVHNKLNEFPNVKPLWYIGFMNGNNKLDENIEKKGRIRYVIDGVTGKLNQTYRVTREP